MRDTITFTIEDFTAGFLSGWYYDSTLPSQGSMFQVEVDEKVVTVGTADSFREDLLEAGLGNGKHAFRIFIEDKLSGFGKLAIRLKDNDGNMVKGKTFLIERSAPKLILEFLRQDAFNLIFNCSSDSTAGHFRLQLSSGNDIVHYQNIDIKDGESQLIVSAPISFMDGNERFLSIGLEGGANCLWQGHVKFKPVLTPREYLKNSHKTSKLISDNAQAPYRYESLKLCLDQDITREQLKNLQTAHSALCEGWEKRKKFPALFLPTIADPVVSIIIPAYNKFELTYHCIASLILAYNTVPFEVILADDCSTDATAEAESIIENLVISRNTENLMFLKNCNKAAEMAKGQYVLFLNNDTEVTSYWLDELINGAKMHDAGMVGSKLLNEDGTLQEAGGIVWSSGVPWNVGNGDNPNRPEYNYVRQVDYLSGAALCIRTDVWEEVGGFSEYLAPAYYEDTDIAFKVRECGYTTLYIPHSEVFHFEGLTHGRDLSAGVKKNQVINSSKFAKKWAAKVKYNGKEGSQNLQLEKDRGIDKRILVLDYTTPDPSMDAGSYAAVQEMKLMQSLGFKVTFATDNLAHLGSLTLDLQRLGVEVLIAPFYRSVEHLLSSRLEEMDAVYITRYYVAENFINRIKEIAPNIPILFNNADLHFLRELRAAKSEEEFSLAIETQKRELNICSQSDAILCYNSTEHAVISSHLHKKNNFHITPWVLEEKTPGMSFDDREGIAFLGGFGHYPNVEAVEYLANEVMPLLQEARPDIKLAVYGSKMPTEFELLESDNIDMVGYAESLDDVYHNHRVFIAPLLSGAGIKGKVLDSMAYGLPSVLSEVAAEGTGLSNGISCFIANTPEAWVKSIIELYDNQSTWNKFAENAISLAKSQYSKEHGRKVFAEIFESVGIYTD
jgi:GT2 family glycosyltransferase/glycosyltransferase involved in cell wall biosynthesis